MHNNKMYVSFVVVTIILFTVTLACGCTTTSTTQAGHTQATTSPSTTGSVGTTQASTTYTVTHDQNLPTELLQPSDLNYVGAFRLPDVSVEYGWGWSGSAMAYYPGGDPGGPEDGYPGSIFGTGHDSYWDGSELVYQYVSEFNIPAPVISASGDVSELNTATTLQDFADIKDGMYTGYMEIPRVGLEYLPAQGSQSSDKLYFCWAPHLDEGNTGPTHGWCELELSNPQSAGIWGIDNQWNYVTTDYIFQIQQVWADTYTPGMLLATGRYRDGGQGSYGPSLFAYGPWNDGNPPASGTQLNAETLLLYSDVYDDEQYMMNNYHHSDEWSGAAWLTAGDKSAVIFIGTKGQGDCWYGYANGLVWPEEPPYPQEPEYPYNERGWWSDSFAGQILFYDPADLAAVTAGQMESYEPQPYAVMEIDDYLYHIESDQQWHHVGAASFDRDNGFLYVFEPLAGVDDKSLVHVWMIEA